MQADGTITLPTPDPDSEAHSGRVREHVVARIREAGGTISFADYMQQVLYAPGLGYYVAGSTRFGSGGDFVTAPEVSSLFGRVVARQIEPVLASMDRPDVLEFGAGTGKLAVDVLGRLAETGCLPARYRILEVSPDLVAEQQARIRRDIPALAGRVEWLSDLPEGFRGVVLGNEVLDAMPVERFRRETDAVRQLAVALDGERLVIEARDAPAWLAEDIRTIEAELGGPLPEGYVSETCPAAAQWIEDLAGHVEEGVVLLFDYGLSRREYYAPDRSGGWLRCHFRHRAHADPLVLQGIQDITAWVDFTRIAEAGVSAGLDLAGYTTQAEFLLAGGLADELAAAGNDTGALSREIKLLTLPGEMGEHFKCMGFVRGDRVPVPPALLAADRRHRL